jgi:hypothetical protein
VVQDALSDPHAAALRAALDDIHEVKLAEDADRPDPAHRDIPNRMAIFSAANTLGLEPAVLDLIRNDRILPKIAPTPANKPDKPVAVASSFNFTVALFSRSIYDTMNCLE